ncbi:hypothetical protein H4R33_004146 [Dimargaris cristalligena]|uniref:MARVEL domain-containing protein n=1 Tax=Dimargaris cristalligena TaxID=215637 RepID=A0A4V1J598_9FUNG|nr:hypothetical protein H4R33_004146 [Dimargaris cristalligena]RKP38309.1 hypothetical protein BJ085DRAFT_36776 [Dimargaris cristalligena]|eukprot:RKP38309.1 hypothetical protein BJ085DRAFT_36776 [Dimargaris cristalligena]
MNNAAHMGYKGLRIFMYLFALLLNCAVFVLSAIVVNIVRRDSRWYAKGPMAWTLFMACFSLLALLALAFINAIRSFKRSRAKATTVRHGANWIEPALLALMTILWASATIATATQANLLSCHDARCKTARAVVVFNLFMSMITSFLTAMTLFGNYSHLFSDPQSTSAPHMTTGTGIGPAAGTGAMGVTNSSGYNSGMNQTSGGYNSGMNNPQYNDKMAAGPAGMTSPQAYGADAGMMHQNAGMMSPSAQPNAASYNPAHPVVDGTHVQPAMPEPRV